MAEQKLDRRNLIKKGALAAGAAWAAPAVLSTAAGAQNRTCYFVKRDAGTSNCNGSDPSGRCASPSVSTTSGCGESSLLSFTVGTESASASVAAGCQIIEMQVKAGTACNIVPASGTSATVTRANSPDGKEISHVNVVWCCSNGSTI